MSVAKPVHPWSEQRKSVENLRPDRQNQSAHLDPRPPGVAHRRCGPSRRHGLLVDGFLLTDAVKLVEMTGPRKTGASLTFSASCAQPRARRRLLPRSASSRATASPHRITVLAVLLPAHSTATHRSLAGRLREGATQGGGACTSRSRRRRTAAAPPWRGAGDSAVASRPQGGCVTR